MGPKVPNPNHTNRIATAKPSTTLNSKLQYPSLAQPNFESKLTPYTLRSQALKERAQQVREWTAHSQAGFGDLGCVFWCVFLGCRAFSVLQGFVGLAVLEVWEHLGCCGAGFRFRNTVRGLTKALVRTRNPHRIVEPLWSLPVGIWQV